jgi:hypothetical protein
MAKEVVFNINDNVKVKLTQLGVKILARRHNGLRAICPSIGDFKLTLDDDGMYETQLWCLIEEFGEYIGMGKELPFNGNMKFIVPEN